MNLLYLSGSLIGVSLIVGLNLLLFGRTKPALGNLAEIAARLAADVPGFRPGMSVIANDGDTALIEDRTSGTLFLVKAVGDRIVTRRVSHGTLRGVAVEGSALRLQLRDFTFANARLALADAEALRTWEARLKKAA
jgi:hypothetical protein